MPKTSVLVRGVGLALRCEICHQCDRFDPESGVCGRCSDLVVFGTDANRLRFEYNPPGPVIPRHVEIIAAAVVVPVAFLILLLFSCLFLLLWE